MAKQRLSIKMIHICIVCVIIIAIIFVAMMFVLDYDENGETNMPFQISKISVISAIDGQDEENPDYKWNIKVFQNNDIYLYIEKNNGYRKQETISSVTIDDINIKNKPQIGEAKIYKPTVNETSLFKNIDENISNKIEYTGSKSTDAQNLQISRRSS